MDKYVRIPRASYLVGDAIQYLGSLHHPSVSLIRFHRRVIYPSKAINKFTSKGLSNLRASVTFTEVTLASMVSG